MKPFSVVFLLSCFLIPAVLFSQEEVKNDIRKALTGSDEKILAEHLNATLDLTLPDSDNTVSKNHALQILRDFFKKDLPESYTHNHEGSSNDGSVYIIGTLKTKNSTYRSYFLIKKINGDYRIVQIQFVEQ